MGTLKLMKKTKTKTETKHLVWWQSGRPRTLFVDDRANLALACLGSSNLPKVTTMTMMMLTMTMMTMMITMIMRATIKVILFTKVSLDVDAGYDEGMGAKKERTKDDWTVRWGGDAEDIYKRNRGSLKSQSNIFKDTKTQNLNPNYSWKAAMVSYVALPLVLKESVISTALWQCQRRWQWCYSIQTAEAEVEVLFVTLLVLTRPI